MKEVWAIGRKRRILLDALDTAGDWLYRLTGDRFGIGAGTLQLERVTVPLMNLPPGLDGLKIGLLSDLHVGRFVKRPVVERACEMLRAEEPDLWLVAGDFTDSTATTAELEWALAPLKQTGAFGVRGNWDLLGPEVLEQRAVRLLINEGLPLRPDLWLGGVDSLRRADVTKAVAGAPPGALRLLMAHEPDLANKVRPDHRVSLVLSGHTHGGQVRLPVLGPAILPPGGRRYVAGLCQAPACQVYVSRGVGAIHLPIRIQCPPEVTLLTLTTQPLLATD